jgi:hypothetical protein
MATKLFSETTKSTKYLQKSISKTVSIASNVFLFMYHPQIYAQLTVVMRLDTNSLDISVHLASLSSILHTLPQLSTLTEQLSSNVVE